MAHVRQQIRDRLVTLLTGLPLVGANVFPMRRYALDHKKLPAILVYTMDESSSLITIGSRTLTRTINVAVETIVKSNNDVSDIVDNICASIEAVIGDDFSLNGLAKSCILTETQIDIAVDGENPISSARMTFAVTYVTSVNDAEIAR